MTAIILDGKATAAAIKSELATRVATLKAQGISPGWAPSWSGTTLVARPTSAASTGTAPRWGSQASVATSRALRRRPTSRRSSVS